MFKELKKSFWDFIFITGITLVSFPLLMVSEAFQGRYMTLGGFEEYANFALFLTILALLNALTSGWLTTGYMRLAKSAYANKNSLSDYNAAFIIASIIQICLLVFTVKLFGNYLFSFLGIHADINLNTLVLAVSFNLIKFYFYNILKVITRLKQQVFIEKMVSKLIYPLSILGAYFYFGKLDFNTMVVLYITTEFLIICACFFSTPTKYSFSFSIKIKTISIFLGFSLPFILSSISAIVIQNIDLLIIKKYLDDESVSYYNSAYKMFTMGRNLIFPAIHSVFLPILIVFYEKKQFNKINTLFFQRIANQLAIGLILITLPVHLFAPFAYDLIYSGKFDPAVSLFRALLVSFVFITISLPLTLMLDVYKIVKERVLGIILMGSLNIVLDYYFVEVFGMIGPTYATGIVFIFGVSYSAVILRKKKAIFNSQLLILPLSYALFFVLSEINNSMTFHLGLICIYIIGLIIYVKKMKFFQEIDLEMFENISIPPIGKRILKKIYI